MTSLIDRNALIAEYDRVHVGEAGKARKLMEEAPEVDAVPVIRCKDCRFYFKSDEKCQLIVTRLHFYAIDKRWTEDSFCSWAERKEE